MKTVAFIGLGNMGGPMAANLVKANYVVKGFDLSEQAKEQARKDGIEVVDNVDEAVAASDAIITMLPAGKHLLSVYEVTLKAAKPGSLFIDCSTVDVDSSRTAHDAAEKAGMLSLDAPVSGGVGGATAGTLTFMAGGTKEAFDKAHELLDVMGGKIVHCGGAGNGQAAKICNNMILGISMIASSEAFNLAEKLGLDHQALFDVASTSSGQCWSINTYCPVPGPVPTSPANNDYAPGFAAALMLKDLKLSQDAAKSAGVSTPLGSHAEELYQSFNDAGGSGIDFSGIINHLKGSK
ncbi:3-hydroxyisobutyrate dehydrogenase [Kiloniella litopenaei]|uniref:3-hydroxyisobutyrate dehydrogenase n=1 Tax=Kiloniella litopenaei TaxID=1549748 RepID=A0A0M2RAF0_9PROT|nr:3-hydroxyisobutyrate dehydrogenase [Kiloniella litopenaei]KKJ77394.1 3-hydroxyisobutyrate dehydrogenase [Kiloniella litopenaei]